MKTYIEQEPQFKEKAVCGIDEAGRGNWAGSMVVAGCILNQYLDPDLIKHIDDSKKTTKQQRANIVNLIKANSKYAFVELPVSYINQYGPKKAAIYGMEEVGKQLSAFADIFLIDAEKPTINNKEVISLIHGDALSLNIAAASIIAKYEKDRLMEEYCKLHPEYDVFDFKNNAGYGTKKHAEALNTYGKILDYHRLEYKPVKETKKIFKK